MKKLVLKVDINDEKVKNKAMKLVSTILGVETIAMDMNEKKLTVTGDVDPVAVVCKLRKVCRAKILTIGTVKEPEKKDKSKKDEPVNSYETVEGGMGITTVFQFMKGLWNKNDPNKDEPKKADLDLCFDPDVPRTKWQARSRLHRDVCFVCTLRR
ncbi:unnamed protein product [Camellia sinensis]